MSIFYGEPCEFSTVPFEFGVFFLKEWVSFFFFDGELSSFAHELSSSLRVEVTLT